MVSLECIDFQCKRIVVRDGVCVIVDEDHLVFAFCYLFKIAQVLHYCPIDFSAGISVESLSDQSLGIECIQDCISISLLASRVHINDENLRARFKELLCMRAGLNIHLRALKRSLDVVIMGGSLLAASVHDCLIHVED